MDDQAYIPLYINVHTHAQLYDAYVELVTLEPGSHERPRYFSVGIHPWKAGEDDWRRQLMELEFVAGAKNCLAIGECGLDRNSKAGLELQQDILRGQVAVAQKLKKPLIVHCVKAFSELITCLKHESCSVPVIVHGFNNNEHVADLLTSEGYYLSFGRALLGFDSNASRVLRKVSRKKFFLETDDADISIKYIYRKASELLGIPEDVLTEQLKDNFRDAFGINVDRYSKK